jgi:type IV pilus assembly protein PilW
MSRKFSRVTTALHARNQGLALVELMIALVLGLVIIGAATGIMLSGIQGFRTTQGLSQVQDAARVGFELLARDIRQAGNVPCGNDIPVVNILNPANDGGTVPWQYDWDNAVRGLNDSTSLAGVTNQIAGTESLIMLSGEASDAYMEEYSSTTNSANFVAGSSNPGGHGLEDGDILFVCNEKLGTIFQMTSGSGAASNKIVSNTGSSSSPGNCSKGFGEFLGACTTNGERADYAPNTVIAQLSSTAWYIGDNGRPDEGGRSLYMARLGNNAGDATLRPIEIASGITDLTFRFRVIDTADFVDADAISAANRWADVNAIEVSMSLLSQDQNISTSAADDGRLGRSFTSVVAIRSRSL